MTIAGFRPGTIVIWAIVAILAGAIAVVEIADDGAPAQQDPHAAPRMLMPGPMNQMSAVEIAYNGTLYRYERDPSGAWFHHGHGAADTGPEDEHGHVIDEAEAERIETALAIFGRTRMERDVARGGSGEAYGIDRPDMIVMVYGEDPLTPLARYLIGDVSPNTVSRYVMVHHQLAIVTIPDYHIDNLIDLVEKTPAP